MSYNIFEYAVEIKLRFYYITRVGLINNERNAINGLGFLEMIIDSQNESYLISLTHEIF